LNPEDSLPQLTDPALQQDASISPSTFIGNRQWQIVPIPHGYLSSNWPIRVTIQNVLFNFFLYFKLIKHDNCSNVTIVWVFLLLYEMLFLASKNLTQFRCNIQ
jgi:hypothetical protein